MREADASRTGPRPPVQPTEASGHDAPDTAEGWTPAPIGGSENAKSRAEKGKHPAPRPRSGSTSSAHTAEGY